MKCKSSLLLRLLVLLLLCMPCYAARQIPHGKWKQHTTNKAYGYAADRETFLQNNKARHIPPGKWKQHTADKEYSYATEQENFVPENTTSGSNVAEQALRKLIQLFSGGLGMFLLWTAIAVLATFVVLMVLRQQRMKGTKKNLQSAGMASQEDDTDANWALLHSQALERGDQRQAIRSSFMWLLQLLREQQLINYRKDKTNYDYYRELAGTPYNRDFRQLSSKYEYVWYGHFTITNDDCNTYIYNFNRMRSRLTNK